MKHTFRVIVFLCAVLCSPFMHAQYMLGPVPPKITLIDQPGVTLAQIVDSMNAKANLYDTVEGGELDQIRFFNDFWARRVAANDSSGVNMFRQYYSSLSAAAAARSCSATGFAGNWACIGSNNTPNEVAGYCNNVWADPANENYILAGSQGGLFRTTDGGANWVCISDNNLTAGGALNVYSFAVNPLKTDEIYIGTLGAGIIKTFDGGAHWQQEVINGDVGIVMQQIFFTPDSMRIYAAKGDSLFTRLNVGAGGPWVNITPPGNPALCSWTNLQFVPGNRSHFFIANNRGTDKTYQGVWYATDSVPAAGDWSRITTGYNIYSYGVMRHDTDWVASTISMVDPDTLFFMGLADNSPNNLTQASLSKYCISTGARTWISEPAAILLNVGYSGSRLCMAVGPISSSNGNRRNIYFGSDVVMKSWDGGLHFHPIGRYGGDYTHGDIRGLCLQKATNSLRGINDVAFFASDGGIAKKQPGVDDSVAGDMTIVDISGDGLNCGTYFSFATGEADAGIGSMMHDGSVTYERDQPQQWQSLGPAISHAAGIVTAVGSDAWESTIDRVNPYVGYTMTWSDELDSTSPNGGRQMGLFNGIPLPLHTGEPDHGVGNVIITDDYGIYMIGKSVWRKKYSETAFTDRGGAWGFPDSFATHNRNYCFGKAINPNDTTFEGYIMYDNDRRSTYYRHYPTYGPSTILVNQPPGSSSYTISLNGIATDPNNTERVWVAHTGYWPATNPFPTHKVDYSLDHGDHWVDISFGLPITIPIGRLVYDEANDVLYCGTDVGIYKCDMSTFDPLDTTTANGPLQNTSVSWQCFSQGALVGKDYPNLTPNDLEINHCQGKLYAATYGRSVWATDLNAPGTPIGISTTIATSTTWASGHKNWYITGSIDVKPGATLTITGADTVHMPKGGLIIVEPGGKLIVDNAMITNDCVQCFWGGIQARGNVSLSQADPANQGWVVIRNGSTIQHALIALANGDRSVPWGTDGGVIQCTASYFVNNQSCADFQAYDNYIGGRLHDNLSFFNTCTFLLNNNYKGNTTPGHPMAAMVGMRSVEGIHFRGCQFLNRDTFAAFRGIGEGIHAVNAGFYLAGYCPLPRSCSGAPTVISRFCGFTNGIDIQPAWQTGLSAGIDYVTFDTVGVGVFVSGFNDASITRCAFHTGNGNGVFDVAGVTSCYQNIGIFSQNATRFRIEGNTFTGKPHSGVYWYNFGTVIANMGAGVTNSVYRNTFGDSLDYGVFAIGLNKDISDAPGYNPAVGLQVFCNAFSKNVNDLYIVPGLTPPSAVYSGIAATQGTYLPGTAPDSLFTPAGNTFTGSTNNIIDYAQDINYCYKSATTAQYPLVVSTSGTGLTGYVDRRAMSATNSCPSSFEIGSVPYPGGFIALGASPLAAHKATFRATRTAYTDSQAVYKALIDFSNTDSLVAVILASTDTAVLYGILSGGSPYISVTALHAVSDNGKLPRYSMMALLALNPDPLRDPSFISHMQAAYSLSAPDVAALQGAALTATGRTTLEKAMGLARTSLAAEGDIIMMALKSSIDTSLAANDSTGGLSTDSNSIWYWQDSSSAYIWVDSISTWLQLIGGQGAGYERVYDNYWRGHYATANSLMTVMGAHIPPTATDSATYATCSAIWAILYNAATAGRNMWQLTGAEYSSLAAIGGPDITFNTGVIMARGISILGGSTTYVPAPILCTYNVRAGGDAGRHSAPAAGSPYITNVNDPGDAGEFAAYPNPASGIVTLAYNIPGIASLHITITNILGRRVMEQNTPNSNGRIYWDARLQPPGIYTYRATGANGVISQGKLTVIK